MNIQTPKRPPRVAARLKWERLETPPQEEPRWSTRKTVLVCGGFCLAVWTAGILFLVAYAKHIAP